MLAEDQTPPLDIAVAIEREAQELFRNESEAAWVGRSVGPWRITGLVGQGGMDAVYGAIRDDGEFELQVAIKVSVSEWLRPKKRLVSARNGGLVIARGPGKTWA